MISQTDRQTEQTGFPSVNKPWLKYYSEEAIQEKLPECTMYDLIYQENQSNLSHTALNYFGKKISYKLFFATVYKGNIIKNLIMDCQSYTKYRPNETTGGIFVSWRRKEELPTGA